MAANVARQKPGADGMYDRQQMCNGRHSYCKCMGCLEGSDRVRGPGEVKMKNFSEFYAGNHGDAMVKFGFYPEQIRNWLKYINRRQLFILNFDDLIHSTPEVMKRISVFLGLRSNWGPTVRLPQSNIHESKIVCDCKTWNYLRNVYRSNSVYGQTSTLANENAPASQPKFPPFDQSVSKCV